MPFLRNTSERYGAAVIALHWLTLLLVAAAYTAIELREAFPKGSDPREALKALHFTLGLSVLGVLGLRLALRALTGPAPAIVPAPGAASRLAATVMHVALYALFLVMPLAGWALLSAEGKPIPFFGAELLPLMGESKAAGEWLEELHEAGGTIGYVLVGLHAAAALSHHYLRGDNTLARMLPGGGRRASGGGGSGLSRAGSAA